MTSQTTRTSVLSAGVAALVLSAVTWIQLVPGGRAIAQSGRKNVPETANAMELSNVFRHVSKQAMPAVVSIATTGKIIHETIDRRNPFGDEELFRRFFGDSPQFREYLDQGPMERRRRLPGGNGSGFIISADGVIMTNSHVVRDAEEVVVRLSDGREFTATDIRTDDDSDVAIVRITVDEQLPFLQLGDDAVMEIGDWVLAFGSPFGLHRTVTQGIISAKSRGLQRSQLTQEFLQTDAAINPGNSGGPLVNLQGQVIGINTAISTASGGYDGVGFAIPVTAARWVADQLVESGSVQRAYLGIRMQQIDATLAEHLNLAVPQGILVTDVIADSPAEKGGFQVGDVLISVNGKTITNYRYLIGLVERLQAGQTYTVRVLRNEEEVKLSIAVAVKPDDLAALPLRTNAPVESDETARFNELGLTTQNVTSELAEQLRTTAAGVVITSVRSDSGAEKAGLEPGMLISRVGNINITNVEDLERAAQAMADSEKVLMLVRIASGDGSMISRFVAVPINTGQ
ncbi:MAG: Do family serine endopeptidase [Fuerstiella sp.]|nr:Do family serine endopeptidase [Fuerstiella sp.]